MQPFQAVSPSVTISTAYHKLTGTTTDCISAVRFSPKGCPMTLVGVTAWDATCSVWQVNVGANGSIESKPGWTTTHDGPLLDLIFTADGRAFLGGCSKTVALWDLASNQKTVVASHDLPVSCLTHVVLPQTMSEVLVTGGWDGKLRWWDLRQPNCVKEDNLAEPVFALDGQRSCPMMAAATGRLVHVYDLQRMAKFSELKLPAPVKSNLRCVACSPQLQGVAVGSAEGRVSFIPIDGARGCTFKSHFTYVTEPSNVQLAMMWQTNFCAFHPTQPLIVSGGGDGKVSVVNKDLKKLVTTLPGIEKFQDEVVPIAAGDLSADGRVLAYAHSYDWAMGRAYYRNQPTSVYLRTFDTT